MTARRAFHLAIAIVLILVASTVIAVSFPDMRIQIGRPIAAKPDTWQVPWCINPEWRETYVPCRDIHWEQRDV